MSASERVEENTEPGDADFVLVLFRDEVEIGGIGIMLHFPDMFPTLEDRPLALVGYPPTLAPLFHQFGLLALNVPCDEPADTLAQSCQTLHFSGALIAAQQQQRWFEACQPDLEARRVERVDAIAFSKGQGPAQGSFTFADALADLLEASAYGARGASVMIFGRKSLDLSLAAPLLRLGFQDIALVADNAPEAERILRQLPVGLRLYPMSHQHEAVSVFAGRADLIVVTAGDLPQGLLQPFHTLLDLTGRVQSQPSGASLLSLQALPTYQLARQLYHATGQRLEATRLSPLAEVWLETRSLSHS